jgi:uncharacterized membrane-anchored protein
VRGRKSSPVSDRFRRDLFAAGEIAESRPSLVVNWVAVRRLAAISASFWLLSIMAVALDSGEQTYWGAILFMLGLPFALLAIALRVHQRLWIPVK